MKVMILAAGRGERLRPLTDHTPKPLLKAGELRLIEHTIHALVKAGFDDIVINYAHLGEQFPKILGNGNQYGATISYSPEQEGGLETAGGIINALPLLGNEPFLVVNGDIWTDYPFEQLTQSTLTTNSLCHLVLVNNPQHNLHGDFSLSSGLISSKGENKYTYSGIGIYHPDLFSDFKVQRLALKPILLDAIAHQHVSGELYEGEWSDIGTVERLQQLNDQFSG
ncbi:MAG: mannose-1-phosphate guanylyltransferase [Gammaproteobacteria bacterium]|nr:MAG: mannose-1-phosphate guanylyltransferase [Gammaproteobacteria bacterium]